MASIEERMSLDAAVKKALAKERAERGLTNEPVSRITFTALLDLPGGMHKVENTDLTAFLIFARKYLQRFPNVPMHLFTNTELESDQSNEVIKIR
jgi:hypothetical protein